MKQFMVFVSLVLLCGSAQAQLRVEGAAGGHWNEGYTAQINDADVNFAETFQYARHRDCHAPECFFPKEWELTQDEAVLYDELSKQSGFTVDLLNGGKAYLSSHPERKGFGVTYDWSLITEPKWSTKDDKWRNVFWSLVKKKYQEHWVRFQYDTFRKEWGSSKLVEANNAETKKRLADHVKSVEFLKSKPKMQPGEYRDIPAVQGDPDNPGSVIP